MPSLRVQLPCGVLDVDRLRAELDAFVTPGGVDAAEAVVLAPLVGERFDGVAVERSAKGRGAAAGPPVRARAEGDLPVGERVELELLVADPVRREVLLRRV